MNRSSPGMNRSCPRPTSRRGVILITAMWVAVVLGALVLIFARSMRVELAASANRVDVAQADMIELGAEQYLLAEVDNTDGEAEYIMTQPGEALQIGGGYVWLLRPAAQENQYEFGITDECSKLNLNYATEPQILELPNMTQDVADSIIDWIDTDSNVTGGDGAENDYYTSLPEPYQCKNQPIETPEELLLVKGIDQTALFGMDRNRNGVIETGEQNQGITLPSNSNNTSPDRGFYPFITCFTAEPNVDLEGDPRVDVNNLATTVGGRGGLAAGGRGGGVAVGGGGNTNTQRQLQNALSGLISSTKINAIVSAIQTRGPSTNIFDLAQKANLTSQDISLIYDKLTFSASSSLTGLINVNTAPLEVLMTLPGIQESDAQSLINERQQQADLSGIGWVADAITMARAAQIGQYLTCRSYFYSGDIVAVSGDGRAFRRVRVVVDARQSPAKIIYRRDLTFAGWPLPESIRTSLRQGRGPGPSIQDTTGPDAGAQTSGPGF